MCSNTSFAIRIDRKAKHPELRHALLGQRVLRWQGRRSALEGRGYRLRKNIALQICTLRYDEQIIKNPSCDC
jgi:hypothetical protein